MAFPTAEPLTIALPSAQGTAKGVKTHVQRLRDKADAGPVDRTEFITLLEGLSRAITKLDQVAATPGIAAYAQEQLGNPGLDIAAEFAAMRSEIVSLGTWVFSNFPKDGGGAWLVNSYDATGSATSLQFTQGQLTGFVTQCDALLATIE